MLQNKFVIAFLLALLLAVIAYNYMFFAARNKLTTTAPHPRAQTNSSPSPTLPTDTRPMTGLIVAKHYRGVWKRDPFLYEHEEEKESPQRAGASMPISRGTPSVAPPRKSTVSYVLKGTMMNNGRGFALLNKRIAEVNEIVDGAKILEIGDRFVTLQTVEGIKTISIRTSIPGEDKTR